jgi:nucleotide-binding universal stress UspA family protein
MPNTFVVAVDGSPAAVQAVSAAAKLVSGDSDHIRILHVQTPKEHADRIHEAQVVGPLYQVGSEVSEEAIAIVSQHLRQCRELGLHNVKEDVITQRAGVAQSIVSYCSAQVSADSNVVLVLGTRELGFFSRAFLGSVADYCVHHASVPVLVVRLDPAE